MAAAGSGGGGDIGADSERRLKKAMDKLYHFPKPKPSSTGSKQSSTSASAPSFGRVAGGPRVARRFGVVRGSRLPQQLAATAAISPPPPCRPWNRADLMRRLASFKAMTWFAKPKAISPVNCARRGWTNIEPDVITCEACGARLLFSTPSSWRTQQVEKGAAVFSLKLDTGHKLLCPWIDNICDGSLALFPPTPPPVLIENYYECFSSLLLLSALPRISFSFLEIMKKRTPQLEQFLSEPFSSSVVLRGKFMLKEDSTFKDVDDAFQDSYTYYQAQKIISLCGWEPHILSYAIDCGTKSLSDANSSSKLVRPEQTSKSVEDRVILYSPNDINHSKDSEFNQDDEYYDPLSVVLDCQFCGACVALWPFSLVERPLQLFKLVSDSRQDDQDNGHASIGSGVEPSKSANIGFNFTIAGGPPPTRQSFRPKVSFPIVSRHLKADLNSRGLFHSSGSDTEMVPVASQASVPLKRKRSMDQHHVLEDDATSNSNNVDTSNKGTNHDQSGDNSVRSTTNLKVSTGQKQGGSHSDTDKGTNVSETSNEEETIGSPLARKRVASTDVALEQQGPEPKSPPVKGMRVENSDAENLTETPAYNPMPTEVGTTAKSFVDRRKGACKPSEKQGLYDRLNEFDPMKQHRTFCPWIVPDDGESLPGWRLTLSALLVHDKRSDGDARVEVQTSFLDEEDDPLTSVRNLFMSPPPKRFRPHQSKKS